MWTRHGYEQHKSCSRLLPGPCLSTAAPTPTPPSPAPSQSPTPWSPPVMASAGKPRTLKQKVRRGGKSRSRGRKKEFSRKSSWIIYHCNVRGFESKKDSITGIINQVKPNILTLNETHMNGNKKPELYGYFSYARNRPDKSMGGVSTCVSNKELGNTISMKYGEGNHEYIVTRHCKFVNYKRIRSD